MQHENFKEDLYTSIFLISLSIGVYMYYPEHVGAILVFGLIGAAYLVMVAIQLFDKF